jgi:hypothetical protein
MLRKDAAKRPRARKENNYAAVLALLARPAGAPAAKKQG